ncbi:MAG: efflux RND transporter permease subunit [Alcanivoracaceae bacterium]|nr:efflux RND transporter permease subunit [Alcanivoracaceae bacterium]
MNSVIGWFVNHHAIARLLMLSLLFAGLYAIPHTRQETLPNVPLDRISVSVAQPELTPVMAERLLCKPLENALYGAEGLTELQARAFEGGCNLQVDVADGYDTRTVLDRVRSLVDRVDNLPAGARKPQVTELVVRNRVARVILSGSHDPLSLYRQALALRESLLASEQVSVVDIENLSEREVALQVSRADLNRFDLTLAEVAASVSQASDARGSGTLRGSGGELLLETGEERNQPRDFLDIPVRVDDAARLLPLSAVASLHDGFAQPAMAAWFDGQPALALDVYRVGDQHVLAVADAVRTLVADSELPDGMQLNLWQDDAATFRHRAGLLGSSAVQGLAILAIMLCLFLGPRLAFWVALGIPVAMLGAMALLPLAGESINTISLFAFILVLGVVVDDAIIVGESIHTRQGNSDARTAAVSGAREMARPLVFAVLTTALAFAPLLFLPGPEGALMRVVPLVAIAILFFSLVESLCILPSHMAHETRRVSRLEKRLAALSQRVNQWLADWLARAFRPFMRQLLNWRLALMLGFLGLFVSVMALVHSGYLETVLFSRVESDRVMAELVFPEGTAEQRLQEATRALQESADSLSRELAAGGGAAVVLHRFAEQGVRRKVSNASDPGAPYRIRVTLKLAADRTLSARTVADRWRVLHGEVPGALSARFDASLVETKPDIHINLYHADLDVLQAASDELAWQLGGYDGVHEVANGLAARRPVFELHPRDTALRQSMDQQSLAMQVRDGFYGIQVDQLVEADHEVPVLLRLAPSDAATRWDLEQFPVAVGGKRGVPLSAVADIEVRQSPAHVSHYQRRRNAAVTAHVDEKVTQVSAVMTALEKDVLAPLVARYPGLEWGVAGKPLAVARFMEYLGNGYMLAMFAIFFLLAILFGNYGQPLLVMTAIPFGLVGAFIGHVLLGYAITLWSMVGVVAVSGVVVNDNLVLLDRVNQCRAAGASWQDAVLEAVCSRFRPILLTSLTTFAGMAPMIMDSSLAARFLVPMAISLGFGVLFATLVSLFLVPSMLLLALDVREGLASAWQRLRPGTVVTVSVEAAYERGRDAALAGQRARNPFADDVLSAAWEAGFNDAAQRAA